MVDPPEAEPVMPPITLAATAMNERPAGNCQKSVADHAECRRRSHYGPKPTRLAVSSTGSTEAFAGMEDLDNSGRRVRCISTRARGNRQRRHRRPNSAHRGERHFAEPHLGKEPSINPRQYDRSW